MREEIKVNGITIGDVEPMGIMQGETKPLWAYMHHPSDIGADFVDSKEEAIKSLLEDHEDYMIHLQERWAAIRKEWLRWRETRKKD